VTEGAAIVAGSIWKGGLRQKNLRQDIGRVAVGACRVIATELAVLIVLLMFKHGQWSLYKILVY
jgi:hypothetical protein